VTGSPLKLSYLYCVKQVLIITYYWPPSGGAGVQRWLKFSGYLAGMGFEPVVLTVDPDFATYPVIDKTLESEIPSGVKVFKTKATDYFRLFSRNKSAVPSAGFAKPGGNGFVQKFARFIRGNFFIPDPRKGWNKYAFRKASELIESLNISTVITTSPPHSTQLIGLKLKSKFPQLRWIADLRDPWTDIYYYKEFYPMLPARRADRRYEREVITWADKIISVGKSLSEMFVYRYPSAANKFTVIANGYDTEDFKGLKPSNPETFTISYVGTLSGAYNIAGLIEALKNMADSGTSFKLRFTGFVSDDQRKLLVDSLPDNQLVFRDYCTHHEAVSEMLLSSVLLLLIPDHASSKVILTGKLFEYIATGKPILCIGPTDGDAAITIAGMGNCLAAEYNDHDSISRFLNDALKGKLPAREYLPIEFSREEGAKKLAEIIQPPKLI